MTKRSAFRNTWKDYLSFSKRDRRGLFTLLTIILLQIIALLYLRYFPSPKPLQDISQFEKEVNAFYAAADDSSEPSNEKVKFNDTESKQNENVFKPDKQPEVFIFNPNQLPSEDWQRLGFSEKQISVIKNYEAKGGKFHSKEDLKKMYCISDKEYNRIESYINIPVLQNDKASIQKKKPERAPVMVDIGTADSSELVLLKGIGPAFARRIAIYREKLGGFNCKEQLKEVWGFSDSLYLEILPNICLKDSSNIKFINLNVADFNALRTHPYIGYQLASLISNYRKQHSGFKTLEEIKKLPLVNEQLYSKLAPYLKIE